MNRREFIRTGSAAAAVAATGCVTAKGSDKLALLGGTPVISAEERTRNAARCFKWPLVNDGMRKAADKVLCDCNMSDSGVSKEFEEKFAKWQGMKYALTFPNGTSSLTAAMWAIGLGAGDEMICTSFTYWASCLGATTLGAGVVFCDVKKDDMCMDPASIEARITPRTKAIMCVHYRACPCDMDAIMAIAKKHHLAVIEDVSHAQGGLYKGRKLGTFGDVAGMSLMTYKSFAIGEAGMLVTNNREIYRRAIRWGHYERIREVFSPEEIKATNNLPFGGIKNRLNQMASAIGIEQLKKYDREIAEIEKAKMRFFDGIKDIKGLRKIYPSYANSNKAGWYGSRTWYDPEAFCGISWKTFTRALQAEGCCGSGMFNDFPLHLSSVFYTEDIYHAGRPTASAFMPKGVDLRKTAGELPVAESLLGRFIEEPWFRRYDEQVIDIHVEAWHKVAANAAALADWEKKNPQV